MLRISKPGLAVIEGLWLLDGSLPCGALAPEFYQWYCLAAFEGVLMAVRFAPWLDDRAHELVYSFLLTAEVRGRGFLKDYCMQEA